MIKGNSGEWSELWVFGKCALEAKVPLCDSDLNPLGNDILKIQEIYREGSVFLVTEPSTITLLRSDGSEKILIKESIRKLLAGFSSELLDGTGPSFVLKSGQHLLTEFEQAQIKSGSKNKQDIEFKIVDSTTVGEVLAGFSIKSQIAGDSTLLNPSKENTNFEFEIKGYTGDINDINNINNSSKIISRIKFILSSGGTFHFNQCKGSIFTSNLKKIDSQMPELLGFATLANFMVKKNNKVLNDVLKSQPFSDMAQSLKINLEPNEIEYKFKSLLRNVALGMVPKTDWNGIPTADGGYLIVKKDLSIVCLHIFNYGEFSNYFD